MQSVTNMGCHSNLSDSCDIGKASHIQPALHLGGGSILTESEQDRQHLLDKFWGVRCRITEVFCLNQQRSYLTRGFHSIPETECAE